MAHPSVAAISATSILPIRPPHPTTPILVPAILCLRAPGDRTVTDRRRKLKCRSLRAQLSDRARAGRLSQAHEWHLLGRRFPLHPPGMALLRSVATVGSYTAISRVFGFIRDVLTAAILGAGPVADAFFVAQRLPNLFRSLFAEGAFSAAFVPLANRALVDGGKPALKEFAEEAFALLFAALLIFVVLGEIFMPVVMNV